MKKRLLALATLGVMTFSVGMTAPKKQQAYADELDNEITSNMTYNEDVDYLEIMPNATFYTFIDWLSEEYGCLKIVEV